MMLEYKGYVGIPQIDTEAGVIRGRVVNTRDLITFQGKTVPEAEQAFRESVEDYLAFCAERGEEPERPFSGKFLVRTKPSVHRALAARAAARGVSLNTLVSRTLAQVIAHKGGGGEKTGTPAKGGAKDASARAPELKGEGRRTRGGHRS